MSKLQAHLACWLKTKASIQPLSRFGRMENHCRAPAFFEVFYSHFA